jgi:hypothetical protein
MNIGYIGGRSYRAIIEHSNITLGINEDTEAVILESALMEGPDDLPCINSSRPFLALAGNPEMQKSFNEIHGIVRAYPRSYLYGFISRTGLSDMIEMVCSNRFMSGDIGPQINSVQGCGIKCTEDLSLALPDLSELLDTIIKMEYIGEICFGITSDYKICEVQFGHHTMGMALYNEIASCSLDENYEWCLGCGSGGTLHDNGVSLATLLSYPPYPYSTLSPFSIKAPTGAEKHLYRIAEGSCELAYVGAWGKDIFEAKRRCRKTIDNCKNYNKDIQHRIDYGHKLEFILSHDRWLSFGGTEPRGKAD